MRIALPANPALDAKEAYATGENTETGDARNARHAELKRCFLLLGTCAAALLLNGHFSSVLTEHLLKLNNFVVQPSLIINMFTERGG